MLFWTIDELMQMTREELCDLADQIRNTLSTFESGSIERFCALTSLDNIRRVMVMRKLSP